ncbi:hypothetical protein [Actinomadura violacea]|uniref:Uncharacterized protein n=1 Tax=Actinomadura violacea TaxID=2819934 RepID=A0ABS3S5L0_9ACTN|nr:hypothetical protein [Actinomadura violacea]MBO2464028.1 hypothetical protein [Actinomadura violacea]
MGESTRRFGARVPSVQPAPDPTPLRTRQESGFLVLMFGAMAVVAVAGIATYGSPYVVAAALAASVSCAETWSMLARRSPTL